MSDDKGGKLLRIVSASVFAVIAALIALDLLLDSRDGVGWLHVLLEASVLVAALFGLVVMLREFGRVSLDLTIARDDAARWRSEHKALLSGLSVAIARQFSDWGLTQAESEIGFLLLKGFSHHEIAELRGTSERTAREQARSLYRKSGLTGRNQLSAFFLEDLLQPAKAD
ncbi:MAG: hypothetical protein RIB03_03215 [Henriciella sp.]|uniref:helix-turn-helix transcriptional regulator n=1 Tax=Henriciella sp. TaxID=1968823 RepID=UPI0032EC304C